jgi:hypothetical protein
VDEPAEKPIVAGHAAKLAEKLASRRTKGG